MTITLTTGDLCGLLTDVAPFAFPKDDLPDVNVIRLEWDSQMLHASATDTLRAARSSWHPDDADGGEPAMFAAYGGADTRWVVHVDLAEAKEIAKVYKLPEKDAGVPLTLDHDNGKLTVARSRDTGHTAHTMVVEGRLVNFPDLTGMLREPLPARVSEVHYSGAGLAAFGAVRQRGGLLRMVLGADRTHVSVGERFVGSIRPQPVGQKRAEATLVEVTTS